MRLKITKNGDWKKANIFLRGVESKLGPNMEEKLKIQAEKILETLKGHITAQDLNWKQLSERTIQLKGHSMAYIESGFLYDSLKVQEGRKSKYSTTFFVGAPRDVTHPSGIPASELMLFLEFGTHNIPPRPLIRVTQGEVSKEFRASFIDVLKELFRVR